MTDAYQIDKRYLRRSFSRAAQSYDAAAVMQREVFERMFSRLDLVKLSPGRALDAGCGTGWGIQRLAERYPQSQLLALDIAPQMLAMAASRRGWMERLPWKRRQGYICGDIEALPLAANSVDLVWSNLAIQWCNDLDLTFGEFHRVMRPDGLLMFSTFGPDTLMELRAASAGDEEHPHVSRFLDMHDIGDALVRAGFADPVMDMERITLTYDDVKALMRDLKAIGAHNATEGRRRGLEGKSFLRKLAENYERFRLDGKLPATYEVVYGHAWKAQSKTNDGGQPIRIFPRK
ncbi:malonyl-CoA O-methyltransferase [Novimethylophilus kurashikiensis]|uniref:Malonyl-[acyl-carrier protein] O-methyltransferase n=1 Tax=Novimethylophilus kurashikiensis TaxID=1825523 RepID=A0A2R5FB61_9PROT|nr:malonyl-ACP O-methyltransferase BioC [Novimethylophilus kurashikiensis]GBG15447.1 malonyl-CoA O-methyltransferase [Novimethylophilus kurashikiensis]